jgi:glutathione-regulated potassium-efflux system protein KefB
VVCVDSKETTNRIVELVTHEFPLAKLLVRSYDREHSLHLVKQKVDYMIRETFESAIKFGGVILQQLGVDEDEVRISMKFVNVIMSVLKQKSLRMMSMQGGFTIFTSHPRPTAPLIRPKQAGRILNDEETLKDLDEK